MMEILLPNKFLNAHQKRHVTLWWDSITGPTNGSISLHSICNASFVILKCLSKVLSKCFVILNSKYCVPKQQALKIRLHDHFSPARTEARNLLYTKIIIYSTFSYCSILHFSLWYLVQVNQQVTIFYSSARWMEMVLYSQMFYAIFQFCA